MGRPTSLGRRDVVERVARAEHICESGAPINAGAVDPRTVANLMAKSAVSSLALALEASGHCISGGFADYRAHV